SESFALKQRTDAHQNGRMIIDERGAGVRTTVSWSGMSCCLMPSCPDLRACRRADHLALWNALRR
ncbi:MAG TPA: hypothetical protein VED41_05010, partial [Solirubrobacteraceae bacterium]|nr:hypothetical protein [Solirubrobacteraceae bacterium]